VVSKICGAYNNNNAPTAGFNTANKVWAGNNAISLIGQECVLQPGEYELCVQFFGDGPTGLIPLSSEKCKSFSIRNNEAVNYQAPQLVMPSNNFIFKTEDTKKPISFRWTPVVPKPQEPVIYKIRVWKLKKGESSTQAVKNSQPIYEKEIENLTHETINNLIVDGCSPSNACDFAWNVQALNRDGKPIGNNNGTSEIWVFKMASCDVDLQLKLKSIECIKKDGLNSFHKVCVQITYSSPTHFLTFNDLTSGLKAYNNNATIYYAISNISPLLTSFPSLLGTTTVEYCYDVIIPNNQTSFEFGVQGDDKIPGPISCQPGAQITIPTKECSSECVCGKWNMLIVGTGDGEHPYSCDDIIIKNCNKPFAFSTQFQCLPNSNNCITTGKWQLSKGMAILYSGTGFIGTLPQIANGTYKLTFFPECNGKKCDPCTYTVIVKDCPPPCDCGKWGDLLVQNAATLLRVPCGKEIDWKCNQPFKFTNTYQCKPNDKTCVAKTSWEVTKDGQLITSGTGNISDGFTPTSKGDYVITLSAECNGKKCDSCTYTVIVKDCPPPCDCGEWGNLLVQNAATLLRVPCGKEIDWKCNQPFKFTNTYQCKPNDKTCVAKTSWEVRKDGQLITSGTGNISDGFTPTSKGDYVITLSAECNGKKCDTCTYTVIVKDCPPPCDCGEWGDLLVQNAATLLRVPCGKEIDWKCNQPFKFTNTYQCKPNDKTCVAKTSWEVRKDGQLITSGTGNISDGFTPTSKGDYVITLSAECNGKKCDTCTYTVIVKDCPPPCDCGEWGDLLVQNAATLLRVPCGKEIDWKCNQPFKFTNTYQCKPNDKTCVAKTSWEVRKDGQLITSGTGNISDGFTPTSKGDYVITLSAECNGKKCDPCTYTVIVKDCPTLCECGTWSQLSIQNDAGTSKYDCGKEIVWNCNQSFDFNISYQCKSNGPVKCEAKLKWVVTKAGVVYKSGTGINTLNEGFSPNSNGVYELTVSVDCGGNDCCPPCKYIIIVKDCSPLCDCGEWGNLQVQNAATLLRVPCGKEFEWKCNQPLKFTNTYQCKPNDKTCVAKTSWEVTKDGQLITFGKGNISDGFTPTTNGVYVITLSAECNGKKCPPCEYKVVVKDCVPKCNCGSWGKLIIENSPVSGLSCGAQIPWNCKKPFNFSNNLICSPVSKDCLSKTNWTVLLGGNLVASGLSATGSFTPTQNGIYKIILKAECGGKECDSCVYKIVVRDCLPPKCNCGTWGDNFATFSSADGTCGAISNNKGLIVKPGVSYSIKAPDYNCSSSNSACNTSFIWLVNGAQVGTGSSLNYVFIQSNNTISIVPSCNGVSCTSFNFSTNVTTPSVCNNSFNQVFYDSTSFIASLSNAQIIDFRTYNDAQTMQEFNPAGDFALNCWTRSGITFSDCKSYWDAFIYSSKIVVDFPVGMYKKVGFKGSTFYGYQNGDPYGNYIIKIYSGNCIYNYSFTATPAYFYFWY
jgi:hypothetical protein